MNDLPYIVAMTPVGREVEVEIIRKGRKKSFKVKLGELDEETIAQMVPETKARLGLTVKELTPEVAKRMGLPETEGVVVVQVERNTAASEAVLMLGMLFWRLIRCL